MIEPVNRLMALLATLAPLALVMGCGSGSDSPPVAATAISAHMPEVQSPLKTPVLKRVGLPMAQEAFALRIDHAIRERLSVRPPFLNEESLDEVAAEMTALLESHGPVDGWVGEVQWTRPVGWDMEPMKLVDLPMAPIWSPYRVEIEIPSVADYAWGFEAYCIAPSFEEWTHPAFPRRPIRQGDRVRFHAIPTADAKIRWHADDDRDRFVYGPVQLIFVERLDD